MADDSQQALKQQLKVFLFTDLVGWVEIHNRVGGAAGARISERHHAFFRRCLERFSGELIDTAGDGFFASFDRPSDALRCALAYQEGLAELDVPEPLRARAGIHMGEVAQVADGALVGVAIDTASRVTNLAETRQILMTRHAFDSVRPFVDAAPSGAPIRWQAHGRYRFRGLDDPLEVFEAGIDGFSRLNPPDDKPPNAQRVDAAGVEQSWWPAKGLEIAGRKNWILQEKLGDGSVGEVWLAQHKKSLDRRIFKFCSQASRIKTLKREVTNFVYLKKTLGDRDDIVRLLDWQFDQPPYFIESDYTAGGDLHEWAERAGGLDQVALATRVELIAQVAEALAAAHSVGVLHKDIKPSNVLVAAGVDGQPHARLADFGIGLILDQERFGELGITYVQMTQRLTEEFGTTFSGTLTYMAPEVLRGEPASTQSDIYSLGIVLYQFVRGSLAETPAEGWTEHIADEVLRDDIKACIHGDPQRRLTSAAQLAHRLRTLDARRDELAERRGLERRLRQRERLRYYVMVILLGLSLPAVLLALVERGQWQSAVSESKQLVVEHVQRTNASAAHWLSNAIQRELDQARDAVQRVAARKPLRELALKVGDKVLAQSAAHDDLDGTDLAAALRMYLLDDVDCAELQKALDAARESNGSTSIFSWALNVRGHHAARSPVDNSVIGNSYTYRDWYHGRGGRYDGPDAAPIRKTHISEPFYSSARGNKPMLAVSTPVWHPDRQPGESEPIGVLLVTLTLENFAEWLQDVPALQSVGEDGEISGRSVEVVIVNDRGQVVAHPNNPLTSENEDRRSSPARYDDELARATTPGMAEHHRDPLNGGDYLIGYSPIAEYDWLVVVQQPQEAVEEPVQRIAARVWQYGWVMLATVSVLAAGLITWLATTVTRRLLRGRASSSVAALRA